MALPTKSLVLLALAASLQTLAGCDTGPYTPGANHSADASTGSMLSGTDTGANSAGMNDPSIRNLNASGAAGGH